MAFEVYGTRGRAELEPRALNELQVYLVEDELHTGYRTVFGGDRFPYHGNFVPGSANGIGFEDLVVIEDFEFCARSPRAGRTRRASRTRWRSCACRRRCWRRPRAGRWEEVGDAIGHRDVRHRRDRRRPDRAHARRPAGAPGAGRDARRRARRQPGGGARGRRAARTTASTSCSPTRRRRGGDLLEHRDARRPDRRRRARRQGDLLREADLARSGRGRPRAGGGRRRPACRSRSASTAASTRPTQAVREAVARGDVGDPQLVRISSRDPEPPPMEYVRGSGGIFLDMTIHDFDMARYVTGSEVVEVFARGAVRVDPAFARRRRRRHRARHARARERLPDGDRQLAAGRSTATTSASRCSARAGWRRRRTRSRTRRSCGPPTGRAASPPPLLLPRALHPELPARVGGVRATRCAPASRAAGLGPPTPARRW